MIVLFVMASFHIAAFADDPTLSRFGGRQNSDLCMIAAYYGISVSRGFRERDLWDVVLAGLDSLDVLPSDSRGHRLVGKLRTLTFGTDVTQIPLISTEEDEEKWKYACKAFHSFEWIIYADFYSTTVICFHAAVHREGGPNY